MKLRLVSLMSVLLCLAIGLSVSGQGKKAGASDPVTGTWAGDWGPSTSDRNQVSVDLKFDGKALTGNVMPPGQSPIAIQKGTFNAQTGAVHMEADAPGRGGTLHFVIDGKLDKNVMTGSWNHDRSKGDFKITKK